MCRVDYLNFFIFIIFHELVDEYYNRQTEKEKNQTESHL